MSFGPDMWGIPRAASASGTAGGVSVTLAADGNKTYAVTAVTYNSDAAFIATIESPAGTVLWRRRYAAAGGDHITFPLTPVLGAPGQAVLIKTSASTSLTDASIVAQAI